MAEPAIRRVETPEEREALYAFRYRVYVEELEMTHDADHGRRQLYDDYDEQAVSYAIFDEDKVVGSLRCLFLEDLQDPQPLIDKFAMQPAVDAFGLRGLGTTSRFTLAPELRSTIAIFRLMRQAYVDTIERGPRINYGDCSPHLIPFYEQLGYRRYSDGFNDSMFGYKIPILMVINDRERMAQVHSPLSRLIDYDDREARTWYEETYPGYVELQTATLLPDDVFFELLADRVIGNPLHSMCILSGLDRQQAQRFLSQATVITVRKGDVVVRQGDRENTLFVMLSGLSEARMAGQTGVPLASFAAGDTFGEIGFLIEAPRTANVIAVTDAELLVLSGEFLARIIRDEPEIGGKVALNLARELAGRLATVNQR